MRKERKKAKVINIIILIVLDIIVGYVYLFEIF